MSADSSGDAGRVPGLLPLGEDGDGRTMFAMPYNESLAQKAVEAGLAAKTEPEARDGDSEGTPDPGAESYAGEDGGPIRRFNDIFTDLGSVQLEAIGIDGHEIANATATLRNEMYRSQFPVIRPRFAKKCVDDDCEAEYDRDVEFCLECARQDMMSHGVENPPTDPEEIPKVFRDHPVRPPNPSEKREAERLAESVNKEGQSLRELMKMEEDDQSRLGTSIIIAKKKYAVAAGDTGVYDRGEIIYEEVDELVRGDPKRVVPVVDENGRVGNHWWACPIHRGNRVRQKEYDEHYSNQFCDECGAELREVFFAEMDAAGRSRRADATKVYFQDEVVTWSRYYPRLHGLDGLSPIHHIWLKQAILHWMDIYGAAFYDPESERYPNKFMVVHTTNPQAWEKQFEKAEEDSKEHPYSEQILMNEYSGESNSTPEVQVIDLMQDDLLGQDQQIREQYKQDIRTHFGVTNIFDSDLKDAGGLNNEGLQLEVTDRTIASAMHDTEAGPLDELAKVIGLEDYEYSFVPPQDTDIDELRDNIDVGEQAAGAGLDASLEDGKVKVKDGDFEEPEDDGEGGLGALFNADEDEPDVESEDADEDAEPDADDDVGEEAPPDAEEHDGTDRTPSRPSHKRETEKSHHDECERCGENPKERGKLCEDCAEEAGKESDHDKAYNAHLGDPEGDEGNSSGPSDEKSLGQDEKQEKLEQLKALDEAFEHIVWAQGEEQKAEPFWDENDVVPDFVQDVIEDVALDAIWDDFESIPGALSDRMSEVMTESLTQPQGWSLSSITENISDMFGADRDDAELVARSETAKILNEAREEGYERVGELDKPDRQFRWTGPSDHRTTDACEWLKEQTEDGVTFDRLIELQKEAYDKFDDEIGHLNWRKHMLHPNERHTFVETFKLEHAGAAGPIEIEHKADLAPAMSGTFKAVN